MWIRGCAGLTNEIAILEVEAVQLIASLLGIHHVLVDDIGGSFGLVGDALADLTSFGVSIPAQRA